MLVLLVLPAVSSPLLCDVLLVVVVVLSFQFELTVSMYRRLLLLDPGVVAALSFQFELAVSLYRRCWYLFFLDRMAPGIVTFLWRCLGGVPFGVHG